MFFGEYSLLAMFDTYPASRCTTQNMYTCVCVGLVVIDSLRTALGSLKEEEERKNRKITTSSFVTLTTFPSNLGAIVELEQHLTVFRRVEFTTR